MGVQILNQMCFVFKHINVFISLKHVKMCLKLNLLRCVLSVAIWWLCLKIPFLQCRSLKADFMPDLAKLSQNKFFPYLNNHVCNLIDAAIFDWTNCCINEEINRIVLEYGRLCIIFMSHLFRELSQWEGVGLEDLQRVVVKKAQLPRKDVI